jgi:hypothetical protein
MISVDKFLALCPALNYDDLTSGKSNIYKVEFDMYSCRDGHWFVSCGGDNVCALTNKMGGDYNYHNFAIPMLSCLGPHAIDPEDTIKQFFHVTIHNTIHNMYNSNYSIHKEALSLLDIQNYDTIVCSSKIASYIKNNHPSLINNRFMIIDNLVNILAFLPRPEDVGILAYTTKDDNIASIGLLVDSSTFTVVKISNNW